MTRSCNSPPILAVVLPCFNEEEILSESIERILGLLKELMEGGIISERSFACFVDDGSRDRTGTIIQEAMRSRPGTVRTIRLTRNYGHQQAILAGMETVADHCDCCITMDADLQDGLGAVREMLLYYNEKQIDIVFGVRKKRTTDSFLKRLFAKTFYRLMTRLGCNMIEDHADFRLMSSRSLKSLAQYTESNLYLRGIVLQLGYKSACVYYDRNARTAGVTKYTYSRMILLAISGITSFSVVPLRMLFVLGFTLFFVSCIATLWSVIAFFCGATERGWSSLAVSIWGLGGIQLMGLGILGEYIGRIFMETKRRPRYLIDYQNVNESADHQKGYGQ